MLRIGRKVFVENSVVKCNGYEIFMSCSCWGVYKNGVYVDTGRIHTLEDMINWCLNN